LSIEESEDEAEEMEEAERDDEESAGEGGAGELMELDEDIGMAVDSLKEHMSGIADALGALIQAGRR
jgi:hypothetical protein